MNLLPGYLFGYEGEQPNRHWRRVLDFGFCVMVGMLAVALASVLGGRSNTAIALGVLAVVALPFALMVVVGSERLTATLVVAALAFSLPINLDMNLFYRHHVGGAPSVTINLTLLLLIVFYLIWIYRYVTGAQKHIIRFYPPLMFAAFALLTLTPLSLFNADYVDLVALEWIRLVCLILAMMATMSLQDDRLIKLWVFILSVQVFIQAGLAGAQHVLKQTLGLGIFGEEALVEQNIGYIANRATGTIGHPNILSYFFEILLPVMLAMALTKQPATKRLWFALVFVCGIGGILTTLSRGSWITLPFSFTIVFLFVYGHRIVRIKAAVCGVVTMFFLIIAAYFAYPVIEKRFTHTDYKSAQSRAPLNWASISIIEKFPIVGVGLNNFAETFKKHDETGLSRIFKGYQHVVHNLHLWILTEVGVVGYLAYLSPFLLTFWIAFRVAPRAPPIPRGILIGVAAGLLAHLAHGMVDPGFRVSVTVSYLIFTLVGICGAIAIRYPRKPKLAIPLTAT